MAMVRGWILVQTEPERARALCDLLTGFSAPGVRVLAADTVTGPHDIIVHVEADDVDGLPNVVRQATGDAPGIEHVITCVVMD
jgi:DNA-binding Lrp family transcriptional regulator